MGGVAGGVAALAGAHLHFHHRAVRVHQSLFEKRVDAEDRGGGVAAGAGDEAGSPDLLPVQLGDAVHELRHEVRARVRLAVPTFVLAGIVQPEVRAQVHQLRRQPLERLDALHGLAMGQTQEQHIARLQLIHLAELELGALAQVGMGLEGELARVALRGHLAHLHPRVSQQQAQQLAAGVAGRADDGDLQLLRHGPRLPFRSMPMTRKPVRRPVRPRPCAPVPPAPP